MNKLEVMKKALIKSTGRGSLVLRKYSPEILMGVGIAGIVGSTVLACKSTLKVESIIDEAKEQLENINYVVENPDSYVTTYTDADAKKDKAIVYTQTGVKFVKLYAPAIALGVISVSCLLGSHNIMRKRNLAMVAAYKAVEQSFTDYRKRVTEEFGEDKDRQYRYGLRSEEVTETEIDADGKKKKVKTTVESIDPNHISQYGRFFDEKSTQWVATPEYNLIFLRAQQNFANDLLHARGHLFLNEVYDMLGIPRSQAGSVVGWVMTPDGDNFVDFGMYTMNDESTRDFVNGLEKYILLDFNVDGVIYDKI